MASEDIEQTRKILKHRGRSDLSDLLKYSDSLVDESTTFGSFWHSTISFFLIYSPIEEHEKLRKLSEEEKKEILSAVLEIYPLQEHAPEIRDIRFILGSDLEQKSNIIDTKNLKEIDFDYINDQIEKCEEKINNKDYDGAITNARTLVESVCLFILDESKVQYKDDGNLNKLYKEVYKVLKMDPSLYQVDGLRQILSGMISIVNGISNLRNVMGDAHAKSKKKYYKPTERHALLAVNISRVISDFLYTGWEKIK